MEDTSYIIDKILNEEKHEYSINAENYFDTTEEDYTSFDSYSWSKGKGYNCPNFPIFNEKMEGLEDGLYLFAAESNMGKSALMSNLIWDYCTNPNNNLFGIYFALDDTKNEMIPRLVSMLELIPISVCSKPSRYQEKIDNGEENSSVYKEWLQKREHGLQTLKELKNRFKLEDAEKLDCGEKILDYCKKLKDFLQGYDSNTNLIIGIDSLFDLNFTSKNFKSDKEKNEYIAQEIKRWAKVEIKAPIFGTIHLRKIDKRRADISDVKESGRYVYDASVVFLLHNDVSRNGQNAIIYNTSPDVEEFLPVIEIQWAKNKKSSFKGITYCNLISNYSKVTECTIEQMNRFNNLRFSSK